MAIVMCEGGYRNVETVYMRKLPADPIYDGLGFPSDHYVLFDEDGRKCVCAFDRSWLFYWVIEREITLVTVH